MNIKKNIMTDDHINSSVLFSKTLGISKTTFHRDFTAENVLKKIPKKNTNSYTLLFGCSSRIWI